MKAVDFATLGQTMPMPEVTTLNGRPERHFASTVLVAMMVRLPDVADRLQQVE
jgi:hypothetical protein